MRQNFLKDKDNYQLCYVKDNFAYFTNIPLSEQTGDDWNDAPYEHNAGEPYYDSKDQIIKVVYEGYINTPCYGTDNSPYSVDMINEKCVAWLMGFSFNEKKYIPIFAGSSIKEFIDKIERIGGNVYIQI